jgi:hypothetical protein
VHHSNDGTTSTAMTGLTGKPEVAQQLQSSLYRCDRTAKTWLDSQQSHGRKIIAVQPVKAICQTMTVWTVLLDSTAKTVQSGQYSHDNAARTVQQENKARTAQVAQESH